MSTYISFLEQLVSHPFKSIEEVWAELVSPAGRADAAYQIRKYIKQYGKYNYSPEQKYFNREIKEMVTRPSKAYYSFNFVNKGPLKLTINLIKIYEFFFIPKSVSIKSTWKFS